MNRRSLFAAFAGALVTPIALAIANAAPTKQQNLRDRYTKRDRWPLYHQPCNYPVINVFDPGELGKYLETQKGEAIVMNILRRNGIA